MPDFNKGDFTQQGVAGHVNANLRLNEKRLVNIDMTSNEEAEGCTIAGTVKDLLNDKVYSIGSGGGGGTLVSLTATENGEYDPADYEADGFSDVTVNVSGGGGIANKKLTVNYTTNLVDTQPSNEVIQAVNSALYYDNYVAYPACDITSEGQIVFLMIPLQNEVGIAFVNAGATATDTVNCHLEQINGVYVLLVTDPTEDRSATVNITFNIG